ncbi:hypothetical protein L0Y65_05575 [Candidatus Micrarchaeota archaeon]|nr:hypothetical protein [Candidatus Micrarchaeota archaeon]
MMLEIAPADFAPHPEKLALDPVMDSLPALCLGAAAIFALALIIYFMLRGKSQFS